MHLILFTYKNLFITKTKSCSLTKVCCIKNSVVIDPYTGTGGIYYINSDELLGGGLVGAESHEYSHTAGCLCAPELTQEIDPNWDGYYWSYVDIYDKFSFTIDGTTSYDYCDETTWKQWVRSSYNVDGFFINEDNMIELPDGSILSSWTDTGSGNIYADDLINNRINYMLFG